MSDHHTSFIRLLPCIVCGDNTATESCHVRFSEARAGKSNPGIGQKPHMAWQIPLCSKHHREQHGMGEVEFWIKHAIDPIYVCLALWRVSGNLEVGEKIIKANR